MLFIFEEKNTGYAWTKLGVKCLNQLVQEIIEKRENTLLHINTQLEFKLLKETGY